MDWGVRFSGCCSTSFGANEGHWIHYCGLTRPAASGGPSVQMRCVLVILVVARLTQWCIYQLFLTIQSQQKSVVSPFEAER